MKLERREGKINFNRLEKLEGEKNREDNNVLLIVKRNSNLGDLGLTIDSVINHKNKINNKTINSKRLKKKISKSSSSKILWLVWMIKISISLKISSKLIIMMDLLILMKKWLERILTKMLMLYRNHRHKCRKEGKK